MDWQLLKAFPVFQPLGDDALRELAAKVDEAQLADLEHVFAEGDEGDAAYFILDGKVKIEKTIDAAGSKTQTLAIMGRGDFFGEMSLFDRSPRSAAAVSSGDTRLARLSRASFDALLLAQSASAAGFLFALIQTLNQRIRRLNSTVVVYHEVGKAIGELDRLDDLLVLMLRQLRRATGADFGLVLLKSEFAESLEISAREGITLSPGQRERLTETEGVLAKALADGADLLVRDVKAEERFRALESGGLDALSLIYLPIVVQGEKLGALFLGSRRAETFDLNDANLCSGVARQAGQAILTIRHRQEEESRSRLHRQYVKF